MVAEAVLCESSVIAPIDAAEPGAMQLVASKQLDDATAVLLHATEALAAQNTAILRDAATVTAEVKTMRGCHSLLRCTCGRPVHGRQGALLCGATHAACGTLCS